MTLDNVPWKYRLFEQQERAREMSKCTKEYENHKWQYSTSVQRLLSAELDTGGCITLVCSRCNRKVDIEIERLLNSGYAKAEDEKKEPTLRDCLALLGKGKITIQRALFLTVEALADISDRLDKLEGK